MEENNFDFTPEQLRELEEQFQKAEEIFTALGRAIAEALRPVIEAFENFGKH